MRDVAAPLDEGRFRSETISPSGEGGSEGEWCGANR